MFGLPRSPLLPVACSACPLVSVGAIVAEELHPDPGRRTQARQAPLGPLGPPPFQSLSRAHSDCDRARGRREVGAGGWLGKWHEDDNNLIV